MRHWWCDFYRQCSNLVFMNQLDPIAKTIWTGRSYAQEMDSDHFDRFDSHASIMAKAHMMRSVVQAEVTNGNTPGFTLVDDYLGFGRVEVIEVGTGQHFLLKARSAVRFEITRQQAFVFPDQPVGTNPLTLLLYQFGSGGLSFATLRAEQRQSNRKRQIVVLDDTITEAGIWPPFDARDMPLFDQGISDDFSDIDLSDETDIAEDDES